MKRIRLALATFVLFPSVVFAQDGWKVIDQTRERSWYWYQPLGERAADGRAVVRLGVLYAAAQRVDSTLTSRHAEYVYHIRCAYMDYHLDFAYWHDADGKVVQQVAQDDGSLLRFCGHAVVARNEVLLTTETDHATGRGRVGIRDLHTLKKLDEWDSHGIDPHQLLLDAAGNVIVANGGVPRTLADRKVDLPRMDASLVRLDGRSGRLQRQWRLDDPRLSLRHLAWSHPSADDGAYLGVAIQAEHDRAEERARAPILAVLDGDRLFAPTRANDNFGYAGDIAAAWDGGFVLSSNQVGLAQLWHPAAAERMTPLVRMEEAYALASWQSGGVLVATALGLVRSHPAQKPLILPWPQPMALDNHWSLIGEA